MADRTVAPGATLHAAGYWAAKYRRSWRSSLLPSLLGPALFMVVMGKVLGGLVADDPGSAARLEGPDHLAYVAPAVVAVAGMLTASAEATFTVFHATNTSRAYEAMLATPLDARAVVHGHLLWMGGRMLVVGAVLAGLVVALGASDSPGVVLLAPVCALTGLAVACGLMGWSVRQHRSTNMLAWQRFGATPMLLFSGVFYPVAELPPLARRLAELTPLWHGAELARAAASWSGSGWAAAGHVAYLGALAAVGLAATTRALEHRLLCR